MPGIISNSGTGGGLSKLPGASSAFTLPVLNETCSTKLIARLLFKAYSFLVPLIHIFINIMVMLRSYGNGKNSDGSGYII